MTKSMMWSLFVGAGHDHEYDVVIVCRGWT